VTDTPTTTSVAPAGASVTGAPGTGAPGTAAPTPPVPPRAALRRPSGSRWRLVAVGVVLAVAFVVLLVKGLSGSLDYFETVDQAIAQKAMLGTQTFRLEGLVVPGTVQQSGSTVRFVAAGTVHRIAVVNHGNPPQLFQPDVPVVVVGHFAGDTFVSDQIIVDHTAQYQQQHPNRVRAPDGSSR
jgi:cytochrome c-type biogenesis protein CcmE